MPTITPWRQPPNPTIVYEMNHLGGRISHTMRDGVLLGGQVQVDDPMLPSRNALTVVLEKYRYHPQFLGIDVVDPNQAGALDDTLLHIAARTGAVEDIDVLVAFGAQVNARGDLGNTPLHEAAMRGQAASIATLLRLGADPNLRNEFEQTAAEVAKLGGHVAIVGMLEPEGQL